MEKTTVSSSALHEEPPAPAEEKVGRPMSKTAWGEAGFRVPPGSTPHAIWRRYVGGKRVDYAVYLPAQVVPKRQITESPPELIDVLAAVAAISRSAKRYRDAASCQYMRRLHAFAAQSKATKEVLYELKDQAIAHLVAEGRVVPVGWHRFGANWAELLEGEGYRFHRPCAPPPLEQHEHVADLGSQIDAKPRKSKEPRLKDAIYTVDTFLSGRERLKVYQWPRPRRNPSLAAGTSGGQEEDLYDEDDIAWGGRDRTCHEDFRRSRHRF